MGRVCGVCGGVTATSGDCVGGVDPDASIAELVVGGIGGETPWWGNPDVSIAELIVDGINGHRVDEASRTGEDCASGVIEKHRSDVAIIAGIRDDADVIDDGYYVDDVADGE